MTKETAVARGQIGASIFETFHAPYHGLKKVRAKLEKQLARYICIVDGEALVLLEGVLKKVGSATPTDILDRAMGYYREYEKTHDAVGGD